MLVRSLSDDWRMRLKSFLFTSHPLVNVSGFDSLPSSRPSSLFTFMVSVVNEEVEFFSIPL